MSVQTSIVNTVPGWMPQCHSCRFWAYEEARRWAHPFPCLKRRFENEKRLEPTIIEVDGKAVCQEREEV